MYLTTRQLAWGCALLGCATLCGCSRPGTAETLAASGTVTLRGQPLAGASVAFLPEKGRSASGLTNDSGEFELTTFRTGDGAVPGKHKVIIVMAASGSEPPPMPGTPEYKASEPQTVIPAKYTNENTTPLTADVKPDGDNKFAFDLTD